MGVLLRSSVKPSTSQTYARGQAAYTDVCLRLGLLPYPATESNLLLFVADLSQRHFTSASVGVYVAAVRHQHVLLGHGETSGLYPRLRMALRAIQLMAGPPRQKLPITRPVLATMRAFVDHDTQDGRMLWAAMTLAHFGLLRGAELCPRSVFDPTIHLTRASAHLERALNPPQLEVLFKVSKTDKDNRGFTVVSACNSTDICAYCAMRDYFDLCPVGLPTASLFQFRNGSHLTLPVFVSTVQRCLALGGFPPARYSGHSFRSGGATTAAAAGIPDWQIKVMGRWTSDAYQRYIRLGPQLLASASIQMAATPTLSDAAQHSASLSKNVLNF